MSRFVLTNWFMIVYTMYGEECKEGHCNKLHPVLYYNGVWYFVSTRVFL